MQVKLLPDLIRQIEKNQNKMYIILNVTNLSVIILAISFLITILHLAYGS